MKKLILVLEIPDNPTEEQLTENLRFIVTQTRAALDPLKEQGMKIPSLMLRQLTAVKKPKMSDELKEFSKALLDHHLKFQPKADCGQQVMAIKRLYETGRDKDYFFDLYEQCRKEYALTSWFTVVAKLSKMTVRQESEEFQRAQLDEASTTALKDRIKGASMPPSS
jgi:hypothetical protein